MHRYFTALAVSVLAATATAQTISIPASVDGDVVFQGALGFNVDDADSRVSTSRSGPNAVRNGIYEFALNSLPSDAVILSATLQLTTDGLISNTGPSADVNYFAFVGDGAITENDHELNTVGTQVAADTYATGGSGVPIGTVLDVDFADLTPLQDAVTNGDSFLAIRSQTVNFVTFNVDSLENTEGDLVPTLVVEFVPEPATAVLLALGALAIIRRR